MNQSSSSSSSSIYDFILSMCACTDTAMGNEGYAPPESSLDDLSKFFLTNKSRPVQSYDLPLYDQEDANWGLEIFDSRPADSEIERFSLPMRRFGSEFGSEFELKSSPAATSSQFPLLETVITTKSSSMDLSLASALYTLNRGSLAPPPQQEPQIRQSHSLQQHYLSQIIYRERRRQQRKYCYRMPQSIEHTVSDLESIGTQELRNPLENHCPSRSIQHREGKKRYRCSSF
jgi:hypothetical protein